MVAERPSVSAGGVINQEAQLSAHFGTEVTTGPEAAQAMTNAIFTDKDDCAYCCQANYYKGLSPSKIGKGQRTHIIEYKEDTESE